VLARGWGEDQCLSIPRGFASRSVAIGVAVVLGAVCLSAIGAATARASLGVFYNEVGTLRLSVDAIGTNAESGIVRAEKPAGATVRKAFLFAASTGELRFLPPDGEVTLDGSEVSWDPSHIISTNINSYNVAADVTSLVKPKLEAAPAGLVDFTVAEKDTTKMDGEILVVIFNDPTVRANTIDLLYGAQNTTGDLLPRRGHEARDARAGTTEPVLVAPELAWVLVGEIAWSQVRS
jgi:hypothetical protein